MMILLLGLFTVVNTDVIDDVGNIAVIPRLLYCFTVAIFGIFLPKYYISQNPSLKIYTNVYHQHPPPILPWQVPENFNPRSVELIYICNV